MANTRRRAPFVTTGRAGELPVGRDHLQTVAGAGMGGPGGGRAGLAVQHEIHVHLQRLAAQRANGVGAHGRPAFRLEGALGLEPVAFVRQLRRQAVGAGEQQLDPLVRRHRAHPCDLRPGEDEARQRRAERNPLLQLYVEEAVAGCPGQAGALGQVAQVLHQCLGNAHSAALSDGNLPG
ncbi:hypothetical protein D9M68_680700 [compost metagenome]